MRFKTFINEAVDVDPSKIDFTDEDKYEFEFDGSHYSVEFTYTYLDSYGGRGIEIDFHGPNGCMPTGKSGLRASRLYGIMLSAVIAYIEKYRPEGLSFVGATSGMDLVYKRFADRYAKDEPGKPANKVFIRIDESDWIRKDIYENLKPDIKAKVNNAIERWKRIEPEFIEDKRRETSIRRLSFMRHKPYFGGFAYDSDTKIWHVVYGITQQGLIKTINTAHGALHTSSLYGRGVLDYRHIQFFLPSEINKVPKEVIADFAQKISNADEYSDISNIPQEIIINIINQNQRLGNGIS